MSLEGCPSLSGIVPVSSDEEVSGVDPLMGAMHMLVPFDADNWSSEVDPPMWGAWASRRAILFHWMTKTGLMRTAMRTHP